MNRRNFLRTLVGGVAASAAVRTWPFRVYSFSSEIVYDEATISPIYQAYGMSFLEAAGPGTWENLDRTTYPGKLKVPLLFLQKVPLIKDIVFREDNPARFWWAMNIDQKIAACKKYAEDVDVQLAIEAL